MTKPISYCLALAPLSVFVASAFAADPGATPAGSAPLVSTTPGAAGAAAPVDAAKPTVVAQVTTAAADAPASDTDNSNANVLAPVVVTSQKRSEDIKSVPISVTAVSGDDLTAQKIENFDDLSRAVPGLSFNTQASEGTDNIVIRGISSTAGSATVGLYLDDVSITTKNFFENGAIVPHLIDLQSVEVLRGPQGTLYGDSSEGGTIRFVSEAPNMNTFSGFVGADTGVTEHGGIDYGSQVSVNLPINPGIFAVRASLETDHDSGWINRYSQTTGLLDQRGTNPTDFTTLHLIGKLTPGDGWTITPTLFYQDVRTKDNDAFYPSLGLWNQNKSTPEGGVDTFNLASLTVKKSLGFADFTSVTGAYYRRFDRQEDGEYFNSTAFAEFFLDPLYPSKTAQNNALIATLPSEVHQNAGYRQFSQEFRLSSPEDDKGPLRWVGGLYVDQQTIHNSDFQQIPGIDNTFKSIYGVPLEQSLVETTFGTGSPSFALFPDSIDESDVRSYTERQVAVFGQADYDLSASWHVGLGARYSSAKENFDSTEQGFYQIGNISPYFQEASFTSFTPKATISHDFDPNTSFYASVGKGFRLGGPTGPIVFGPTSVCNGDFQAIGQTSQPIKFDSDSLVTYEVGTKNSLDDNRIALNAAVYYTNWSDIQQQIYLPTCGYYFTANVGDARILGSEIEAAWRVTRNLRAHATLSAQSASITRTNNPIDVPVGAHLIDVPSMTATLGGSYAMPIADGSVITYRLDYSFTGHSYGSYQTDNSNYFNPGYGVVNLSATLARADYEVSLYAKNAFSNETIIQRPEINTVFEGYTVHPRIIGISGRFYF
jgi:outer membrane receptor protein involved in Fe transport